MSVRIQKEYNKKTFPQQLLLLLLAAAAADG